MDIDEINTFVMIAQLGGFTRAGDRLHRSQPAISRRISLLEQELGAVLLERARGGVSLTEAGRAFLPFAEAVLAAVEDGRQAVRGAIGDAHSPVSLALVGTLADSNIVDVLRQFARRSQSVALNLRTATSNEVSELVRRGEVTLGLRYFSDERPELVSRIVGVEPLRVIASPEHRMVGKRMRQRQLAGEKWVSFPVTRGHEALGRVLERQLIAAGVDDPKVTVIDSLTAQKRLVEAGFGIALVPESSVRDELRLGILVELDVPAMRTGIPVTLIHRRNAHLSRSAQALIGLMSDASLRLGERRRAG